MTTTTNTNTLRAAIEAALKRRSSTATVSTHSPMSPYSRVSSAWAIVFGAPVYGYGETVDDALRALAAIVGLRVETCGACNGRGRHAYGREAEDGCDECECAGIVVVDPAAEVEQLLASRDDAADAFDRLVARVWRAATGDTHEGPASVDVLLAAVEGLRRERERLQRACDEGLPRERIDCPACGRAHVEGPRHDDPSVDGRTRPHHTHRCYHCGHVWDAGRWSFGVAEGGR